MTPEQLKASILQMAIQGKLVEQRAEEGTAEELLFKISEQRNQLIKDKILKKNKPLEPIDANDLPFDLPQSWRWVKWGDIVNVVSARRVHQSDWQKEGIPFYRAREIAEMSRNNGQVDNELFISDELYEEFSKSGVPKPGDIMVTAVGTLGKTYIVKEGDKFYYKDASVICFENHFNMCAEYLSMMMDTSFMKQQIKSNSDGTTVATLTMVRMNEYLFPLPPLEEQYRIVAKIEELIPYIEQYAKAYEKLEQFNAKFPEEMKKSILQYAIQGKLVEQRPEEGNANDLYQQIQEEKQKLIKEGKIKKEKSLPNMTEDEILFDIPDTWKWVRLGHIITFQGGYAFKSTSYVKSSNNQVIRLGNVKNNNLLLHEKEVFVDDNVAIAADDYKLRENDILVTMTGTRRKKDYFFTLIVDKNDLAERNLYLNQRVGCFRALPGIDVEYLLTVLQNEAIKNVIFTKETGTANQGNLGSEDMKEFVYIPLPPYDEQKRIVEKLKSILPYCYQMQDLAK